MLNYRSTSRPICLLVYLLALLAAPWGCGTSDAFVETGLTPATGAIIEVDAGERGTNSSVSFGGLRIGATDKNGLLFLPQLLPDDVEVHAELPVLAQSSDPPNALIVNSKLVGPAAKLSINVPNHLVTALVRSDAGLSYDEAENRIRKFLVIESQWNLSSLEESLSSPFSHRAFFDEAARSGGIEEFTSQLLREESAGLTHPFPGTLGSGDESSILASLAENVAADIVSDGASDVIGWLARALGFGLGGSDNQEVLDALQNVENTLNQQFAQFREELTFTNLKTEVTDPISSDTTDFYQTAQGIIPASPPFSLYSLSSGVSALLQILEQRDYWTVITSLFSTLIGSDETVAPPPNSPGIALRPERLIAGEIYPKVGIDSGLTTTYQGYGAFSNSTLKPVHDWHTYYRAYGVLAMNLLAESAHATVDGVGSGGPSLAEAIRVLQIRLSGTTELGFAALYKAPDQLVPPLLPSDQVFVDLENGLMWCTVARGDLTYSQSVQFANSLSVGPYQNWRVPYVFELDSLYARIDG
ncbi:MAG: hypothetical protein KC800_26650, partial [Candidatus Eremiobacteraeota bacterium]|nr:hypothetical protein [Candidatus Eremiobacteraeota bacterium]